MISQLLPGNAAFIAAPEYANTRQTAAMELLGLREGMPITLLKLLPSVVYSVRDKDTQIPIPFEQACLLYGHFTNSTAPENQHIKMNKKGAPADKNDTRTQLALALVGEAFYPERPNSGTAQHIQSSPKGYGESIVLQAIHHDSTGKGGVLLSVSPPTATSAHTFLLAVPHSLASHVRTRPCPACWSCGGCEDNPTPLP